jgi:DNA-binding NtrC family response regulator
MPISLDAAQELFRTGSFVDLVEQAPAPSNLRAAQPELRLLVAHALFHTANTAAAERIAEEENSGTASPAIRAHCEQILGLLRRRQGAIAVARNHFRTAIQLAKEIRDHKRAAWAGLQLFRALAESETAAALAGMLPEVRNAVVRAADVQVSAYLHDSIALMEVANGRLSEAQRHVKLARSLLEADPNAWLLQVVEISSFFVAFLQSDYSSASQHLQKARKLLAITGDQDRALIECNDAHALIVTGKYEAALRRLRQVSESSAVRPALAALEGMARAYLATGELEKCESVLARYESGVAKDPGVETEFVGRWTGVTRLKLLLRQGLNTEAVAYASECIERVGPRKDRLLIAFLRSLRAEALALSGDLIGASGQVAEIACDEAIATPDQYAHFCRAASVLLRQTQSTCASTWAERAKGVWEDEGNTCAVSELLHVLESSQIRVVPVSADIGSAIVSSLASAFTLTGRTKLLARELQNALRLAGFSKRVEVVESDSKRKERASANNQSIDLGEYQGRRLSLTVESPSTPAEALLLGDVFRIAKAANSLDQLTRQDRDRAALWPADPIETEAGALFLAEEMQALLATARRIAPTTVPVLLTGETGTGKEVLARLIHAYSKRAKAVFQPFNCSAVPRDMLDSQLFGHRRGSFTGAADNFQGVIRAATGGTLFLDEIGETTLDIQPKLLRFLESSEVHPLGELHPSRVDVRVIAATNADLDGLVSQGRFREDLFYRLNIVRLHLPPLRERRVEIPSLAHHYLHKHAHEYGKGDLRLSEETMEFLVLYRWPGNVRQLANEMRRLAALAETGAVLMPEHLSPEIAASRRTIPASERTLEPTEVVVRLDQPMAAAVQHLERALILHALRLTGSNMEQAAGVLGLSRKGLYLKRQRYGIEIPAEAEGLAIA